MCDAVGKRLARYIMKAIKPLPVRKDPVESLPEEVLHLIWRLLDLKDLLSASLVSTQWHASLSCDNVWKRYTEKRQDNNDKKRCNQIKRSDKANSWKRKFLSQRSLLHNWSKNRYHTCIKTPVIGNGQIFSHTWASSDVSLSIRVVATDSDLCIWRDRSLVIMSPTNTVITNHVQFTDRIESVETLSETDLLLVTTEARSAHLYRSSQEQTRSILSIELDEYEKQLKLTSKYLCRCTFNKLIIYDLSQDPITNEEISLPDCKNLNTYDILNSSILIRYEPLDFNYECIYSLYDIENQKWSIITKISTSPLGVREHFVFKQKDNYLLVNYLLVDDVYMYSNVYLYNKEKSLTREIISNCRRRYFCADFAQNICLFTVADYRLSAIDMNNLKSREIYVSGDFKQLTIILNRFFLLNYIDRLEIWDLKYWKRLYCIKVNDKDKVVIRDDFISITSWPGTSLPPSLRILNFTQPELTESPCSSTFDLSNIFI